MKDLKDKLEKKYRHCSQLRRRIDQLESMLLVSQSGVVSDSDPAPGTNESETQGMINEQITSFADQDAGWTTEKVGMYEPTMDLGSNTDSDLGNFLQRPVRESAQSWLVGQPFFYKFNPWQKFCENSFVREKIKNFELLRMKLHVKIVISGTKFHYGRALVSYNPYIAGDQVTVQRNFIRQDLIGASQKPHFFLNPTKNTGGELCLPFFYPKNFLEIPKADWDDMGEITISSFGNLFHSNFGQNDPVTITTYIWAEDVILTMPTSSDPPTGLRTGSLAVESSPTSVGDARLLSQAGRRGSRMNAADKKKDISANDEYGQGIISKPAAAIAKAAGALSNLPVIGPYMTATQIGANATSKVASLFGYSRPNVVTDVQQFKPLPTGLLANTDAADAAIKLTLDSKAELTVDSRTVGLDGTDEMGILDYVKRESYLTSFTWTTGNSPDELLWNTRVLPMQLDNVNGEIHMTPLAHMAAVFEQWQGSLKFRFQIVKSDFHKGRVLVRWDPNAFTSDVNYNTNYSRVVDIAETDDFEVVVGWGQAAPWKLCGNPYSIGSNFSDSQRLSTFDGQGNGVLELAVINDLVSPTVDSPISVNVFVSACDDFKFAGPRNKTLEGYHLFPPPDTERVVDELEEEPSHLISQSGKPNVETGDLTMSDKPTASGEVLEIASKSNPEDATYLVYYGDPPCSIRELCKRYTFTRFWYPPPASQNGLRVNQLRNKNMPYYTGYDPQGIDATQDGDVATFGPTAYSSWFTPSFAGMRGAYRKKYFFTPTVTGKPNFGTPLVIRDSQYSVKNGSFLNDAGNIPLSSGRVPIQRYLTSQWGSSTGNGTVATNVGINNTIEVELPYYRPLRFSAARTVQSQELEVNSHIVETTDIYEPETFESPIIHSTLYQQHDAVGEDFALFFFTGVPIYYQYTLKWEG